MVAASRPGPRLPPVVTNCLFASEMAPGGWGGGGYGGGDVWRILQEYEGFDCDRPLAARVTVGWRVTAEAGQPDTCTLHLAGCSPADGLFFLPLPRSSSASLELAHAAWIMARLRPRHHSDEYFLARGQGK